MNVEATPNPDSLKFLPEGVNVLESGTLDFASTMTAAASPLAKLLFQQVGVKRVFLAQNFITITKDDSIDVCNCQHLTKKFLEKFCHYCKN